MCLTTECCLHSTGVLGIVMQMMLSFLPEIRKTLNSEKHLAPRIWIKHADLHGEGQGDCIPDCMRMINTEQMQRPQPEQDIHPHGAHTGSAVAVGGCGSACAEPSSVFL